uniref:hypothetical protein n=1 Tax=Curtanaerobium respiraculi TaxID=2949669 RepID=UPI0024B38857
MRLLRPVATTIARSTPLQAARAASISPSSTRWPRTFTCCWDWRLPRNSMVPSGQKRPSSPVRY